VFEVVFIRRIRSEIKFKSADQLVEQIRKDIQTAKTILADLP
jgi:FAD synthase